MSENWRAVANVEGKVVTLILGEDRRGFEAGSNVNARFEAGEWRVG
jgi:hypothetical protein